MAQKSTFSLEEILPGQDLSWVSPRKKRVYELISALLGRVYYQVNWHQMSTSKIATDIFEHRIKNSSRKPTVAKFVNKLCNQLSIQALHDEPELILEAEKYADEFLDTVRTESQLCVMLARRYSQLLREKRKEKQRKAKDDEE